MSKLISNKISPLIIASLVCLSVQTVISGGDGYVVTYEYHSRSGIKNSTSVKVNFPVITNSKFVPIRWPFPENYSEPNITMGIPENYFPTDYVYDTNDDGKTDSILLYRNFDLTWLEDDSLFDYRINSKELFSKKEPILQLFGPQIFIQDKSGKYNFKKNTGKVDTLGKTSLLSDGFGRFTCV